MTDPTSKERSLLPCPFCGAPATLETIESKASPGDLRFSAGCNTEDCIGYQSVITFARRGEAATAWNRRTLSGDSSADVLRTDDDPLKPPAVETDELSVAFWKAEAIAATRIVKAAAKAFPNDDGWLHAAQSFLSAEGLSDETTPDDLARLYDVFHIGSKVRNFATLLANVENAARRSDCLSAIEREFTRTVKDEDGEDTEECPLNWGADAEEYIEQFRAALASRGLTQETSVKWPIPSQEWLDASQGLPPENGLANVTIFNKGE